LGHTYQTAARRVAVVSDYRSFPDWSKLYDKNFYIDLFVRRNERVIKYFSGRPNDLLVLNLEEEVDVSKIIRFLGYPPSFNFALPHCNRSISIPAD
jgi:hypothetical protein